MANVRSLDDLRREGGGGDDSDDDKHNDYYAGGEKSGQLIRGRPEESDDEDRVDSLFNKARQAGAQQGTSEDLQGPRGFQGQGRTLAGGSAPAPGSGQRTHVIAFYRNGVFTVDDGPARRVDDPANFSFIDSISKGECPEELELGANAPVTVNLVRKEEDYKEPEKPKYTAFQGSGRTLAGEASGSGAAAAAAAAQAEAAASASEWAGVDESKPTTSLQLRLADGSRMVARFNHTHLISDIRRFIRASRPDMQGAYQLMTAFPNKLIEDESLTLEAAGLLNAVVIQKK